MRARIQAVRGIAFASMKEAYAYRSEILISLFNGPFLFFVQFCIWKALFTGRELINGFTFEGMLGYFGLTTIIGYLTSDSVMDDLQYLIRSGQFLTFMLKPFSFIRYALAQKLGFKLMSLLLEFIPVYLLFVFLFRIPLIPKRPLLFVLSLVLSFLVTFFFNLCIGISSFWMVRNHGMRMSVEIVKRIFSGTYIPLTFFPLLARKLFMFLPFQYMTYMPVMLFGGSTGLPVQGITPWGALAIQSLYALFMGGLTLFLWNRGIKRFTGVGA